MINGKESQPAVTTMNTPGNSGRNVFEEIHLMKKTQYTPGPWNWVAQGDADEYCILANDKRWVIGFRINGEIHKEEQEANARLMAQSPAMYNLLKEAQARIFMNYGNDELYNKIDAIIAAVEEP
jgi:hypothetical protein